MTSRRQAAAPLGDQDEISYDPADVEESDLNAAEPETPSTKSDWLAAELAAILEGKEEELVTITKEFVAEASSEGETSGCSDMSDFEDQKRKKQGCIKEIPRGGSAPRNPLRSLGQIALYS